jgi:hypothetical protein
MECNKRESNSEPTCKQGNSFLPVKKRKLRANELSNPRVGKIHLQLESMNNCDCSDTLVTSQDISQSNISQYLLQSQIENERNMAVTYEKLCKERSELLSSLATSQNRLLNREMLEVPVDVSVNSDNLISTTKSEEEGTRSKKKKDHTVFDSMWQQRYDELVMFWEKNGHCCVPQRYIPNQALGKWVHKQRQEFRKKRDGESTSLTPYRVQALKKIGFQVDTKNRAEALWKQRYKELLQFVRLHGHCNVPQKYSPNKALGKWVHRQRHEFKKMRHGEPSFLTKERIEALDSIGFQRSPGQQKKNEPIQISSSRLLPRSERDQEFERGLQAVSNIPVQVHAQLPIPLSLELQRQICLQAAHDKMVAMHALAQYSRMQPLIPTYDRIFYSLAAKSA